MSVFRTLLEPDAVKVARPVLRGEGSGNTPDLPDRPLVPDKHHLSELALLHKDGGCQQLPFAHSQTTFLFLS